MPNINDFGRVSSMQARRDTTALLIGLLFREGTKSNELMEETLYAIGDDSERLQAIIGSLIGILHSYVTVSGTQPSRLQELVDHMVETVDV